MFSFRLENGVYVVCLEISQADALLAAGNQYYLEKLWQFVVIYAVQLKLNHWRHKSVR